MAIEGNVYAVLWSDSVRDFKIEPLLEAVAHGAESYLAGRRSELTLVALAASQTEASQLRDELQKGRRGRPESPRINNPRSGSGRDRRPPRGGQPPPRPSTGAPEAEPALAEQTESAPKPIPEQRLETDS